MNAVNQGSIERERKLVRVVTVVDWCFLGALLIVLLLPGIEGKHGFDSWSSSRFTLFLSLLAALFVSNLARLSLARRQLGRDVASANAMSEMVYEAEHAPILASFRGGARLGSNYNATWPLAKFVVKRGRAELSMPVIAPVRLEMRNVERVEVLSRFLYSGVRIVSRGDVPTIIWWTRNPARVVEALRSAGCTVA